MSCEYFGILGFQTLQNNRWRYVYMPTRRPLRIWNFWRFTIWSSVYSINFLAHEPSFGELSPPRISFTSQTNLYFVCIITDIFSKLLCRHLSRISYWEATKAPRLLFFSKWRTFFFLMRVDLFLIYFLVVSHNKLHENIKTSNKFTKSSLMYFCASELYCCPKIREETHLLAVMSTFV